MPGACDSLPIAQGISRVMGAAGPGGSSASAAAGLSAAPADRPAPVVSASSRARSHSRSPAPLPKRAPRRSSSTVSVARGSVALAESGPVTGLAVKSCPPVPPAQLRLSRVSPLRLPALQTSLTARRTRPRTASQCRCSRCRPAGRRRWSWSARSRQAPPSPAQSRQALHVARDLNALAVSRTPRGLRLWRRWLWFWSWMRCGLFWCCWRWTWRGRSWESCPSIREFAYGGWVDSLEP